MDKYLGKRLDGRYEIHELIGIGGMANVYRCTDTLDDREVAIKILKDEFLNNEEFIRRFKNESKAIAMLSHPNIVKVYDVSFGDIIQYIVMEYIDGITLKEYIERQGVIEWKDALHLTTQVLRALQHAHESGIVHRDIKPQNIMLLQDGTIKVTDFGIARFSDKATRTMTDQAIGSVHYIAPEQARGDVTDGKTDIYSVGVMLYEMLAGKLPFDGDTAVSVALMQLNETPRRPREINPSIPVGLEQITIRAMEKEPEKRYTSAAEMLSDIDRFRMNPSIVFDYGTSFVDDAPTKYVDESEEQKEKDKDDKKERKEKREQERKARRERKEKEKKDREAEKEKEESARRAEAEEKKSEKEEAMVFEDEEIKEHGNMFYAVKGVVIAALVLCVIFGVLAIILALNSNQAKDVQMPGYVGKTVAEIKENNPENFHFEIKSRFDESQTPGIVLAQDPAEFMTVKSGSTVVLTVNSSEDEISVPFFNSNFKQEEVASKIKDLGLIPEPIMVENEKTAKDYVIGTFPVAGSKTPIGSTGYIYVSKGERPEIVEIPSVIGQTIDAAQSELENLGFTVETILDDESKDPKDTVIGAAPLPHGKVEAGTLVTLTVSTGKGDKRKVTLNVDLPKNLDKQLEMTVLIDQEIQSDMTRTVNPIETPNVPIVVESSGNKRVTVQLDGQPYREYALDFTTGSVSITTHDYVATTTEPVVTDAPIEYTEYVDPYATEYVDPGVYEDPGLGN